MPVTGITVIAQCDECTRPIYLRVDGEPSKYSWHQSYLDILKTQYKKEQYLIAGSNSSEYKPKVFCRPCTEQINRFITQLIAYTSKYQHAPISLEEGWTRLPPKCPRSLWPWHLTTLLPQGKDYKAKYMYYTSYIRANPSHITDLKRFGVYK